MKSKKVVRNQLFLEHGHLSSLIDLSNEWCLLSQEINWERLDKVLSPLYAKKGRPAKSIRLMCSLLIIKQLQNLSDARVVNQWKQNPYYQYFGGEEYFQWEQPCTASELTHFRNRIGELGVIEIFRESIIVNGEDAKEVDIIADTTVQEKNITYPTDLKLHIKIIKRCWKVGEKESVQWRQSYTRTMEKLKRDARFGKGKKQAKTRKKAIRRIKTIANTLVKELLKKLGSNLEKHLDDLKMYEAVLNQTINSKNKIYSLHEPEVRCIAKGKANKKYEFGNKISFALTLTTNVIVSVVSFIENLYDGATIKKTLEFHEELTGIRAKRLIYDRGGRGQTEIGGTKIIIPDNGKKKRTDYQRRKAKKDFRRRSAIEPVIGHLKQDYRMLINYLKGTNGDVINALMAGAAFNFKRRMRIFISFLVYYYIQKKYLVCRK